MRTMFGVSIMLLAFSVSFSLYAADNELPNAVEFDGQDDYVNFGNLEGVELKGELTFEMWVNIITHDDNNRRWMLLKESDNGGIYFSEARTGWEDSIYGPSNLGSSNNRAKNKFDELISTSTWTHIAFTARGNSRPTVYVNGEEVGTSPNASGIRTSFDEPLLAIPGLPELFNSMMHGQVRDVRLWNRVLSGKEIRERMNAELTGTEEGLVGWWPMNEGKGDVVHDRSGNDNHGTIEGAVWRKAIMNMDVPTEKVLPAWLDVLTDEEAPDYLRLQALDAIKDRDGDVDILKKLAEQNGAFRALARLVSEDPSSYIRDHVKNTLNRLDPEGEYAAAIYMDALKNDPDSLVVPLGNKNLLLKNVGQIGNLDIALSGWSRKGVNGDTVRYPLVFRNAGDDSVSVHIEAHSADDEQMKTAVTQDRFELKAGEVATSFVKVTIGDDVQRGQYEKQQVQITVTGDTAKTEQFALKTMHSPMFEMIDFGGAVSEQGHDLRKEGAEAAIDLKSDATDVEGSRGPAELDADKPFIKFIKPGAHVDLELACDPDKQNYMTVKVWGSSGTGNGKYGGKLLLNTGDKKRILTWHRKANPLPGRFYYGTAPIPMEATEGNPEVEIRLEYHGRFPSPEVYAVYSHQGSYFKPPRNELQGEPFELGPPRPEQDRKISKEEEFEHWKTQANRGFHKLLDEGYQIYGKKYKKLIQKGKIPKWTWGAILTRSPGATAPKKPYKKMDDEIERWGGWLIHQGRGGMWAAFNVLTIFRHAYTREWSDFYQDEEMLHRFVAAMDFYSRAQGSGGLYRGPGNHESWIGGPDRKPFQGRIFQSGNKTLWPTYLKLYDDLKEEGLLDIKIDHDLNPDTPKISRRKAYAKMPERSLKFVMTKINQRPVCNQVIYNYINLGTLYRVLRKTAPEVAEEKKEKFHRLAEISAGIRKHPGNHEYMFSPKGISNEQGFSSGYGVGNPSRLAKIARLSGYENVKKRVPDAYEAYSQFLYLTNDDEGYRMLARPEYIGARSKKGFPGTETYLRNGYAANELNVPEVIRQKELYEKHNRHPEVTLFELGEVPPGASKPVKAKQLQQSTKKMIGMAEAARKEMKKEVPHTDYRLPTERDEDTVFVDEYIPCAAIRHGDATMFVRFDFSDIAILRYMTPEFDRLARVKYNESGPNLPDNSFFRHGAIKSMRYGPYLIVLNGSEEETVEYQVPDDLHGASVRELRSGRQAKLKSSFELSPLSSYVFVVQ